MLTFLTRPGYIAGGVDKTWGRPWPTLWPTLWPTGGQIFKNINKTSVRVERVSWHKITSLVVSCIPLIRVYEKSLTPALTVTNAVHYMFTLGLLNMLQTGNRYGSWSSHFGYSQRLRNIGPFPGGLKKI